MSAADRRIAELIPLKPVEFAILIALAEGSQYGYSLAKQIAEDRHGAIRLPPSNLYHVIDRLIAAGVVRTAEASASADDRRQYFALTAFGRRVLAAEARRVRQVVESAERLNLLRLEER